MSRYIIHSLIITVYLPSIKAKSSDELVRLFENSALKYNVPVKILLSVSYIESRLTHINAELEPACNGMPASYGIMGLRNDNWFGHSLLEAADILRKDPQFLIDNINLNIEGAAVLLSSIANKLKIDRNDLNAWKQVLEIYSGIPQEEVRPFYSFDVLRTVKEGINYQGITFEGDESVDLTQFPEWVNPENKLMNIESEDYGPAVWSPSVNFTPGNINQLFSVVHTTQGSFSAAVSWLQNPAAQASTHYIIRSSDGYIVQLVREQNKAWHAVCWNGYMLGVEHEGFVDNPAWYTDAMYLSSAALFRHFCLRYNIPFDKNRIIGHNQWQNSNWVNWVNANYSFNPTCNSHTDPGQYWDWDFYLQLVSKDSTPPLINGYSPSSSTDSVWANIPIKIKFNQRMKKAEAQNAFSISPAVSGTFSWENNGRTLVFTPTTLLQLGVTYTVRFDSGAVNYNNIPLQNPLQFSFVTRSTSALNITKSYPAPEEVGVSTTVKVVVRFDSPLLQSSLAGNILFQDSAGTPLALKNAVYQEIDGKGIVSFSSLHPLQYGKTYSAIIKAQIKNVVGAELGADYVINFTTVNNTFIQGTVVDNLEAVGNWKDPNYSGSTTGTDPNGTTFTISSEEKINGSSSGKITYVFTGSTGVCRTFNASKPVIGSNSDRRFGMWVYGDLSYNILEFWFYYNTSSNTIKVVDTLDWTGWRFIEIPLGEIGGSGERLFHSVVIRQTPEGLRNSFIYIDGIQYRDPSISDVNPELAEKTFFVEQNFPNPFNPQTTITFTIPEKDIVTVAVYDILGNEVERLLEKELPSGKHSVFFNGEKLASGIYYYRIIYKNNFITKKMSLLK